MYYYTVTMVKQGTPFTCTVEAENFKDAVKAAKLLIPTPGYNGTVAVLAAVRSSAQPLVKTNL